MPFICIAFAGIAVVYYAYLTVIQVFSGPRRDPDSSKPVPRRALSGNFAMPVLGHTNLFLNVGGDLALLFPPNWKEWRFVPCSQPIGPVFSVFVWGKWRVIVNGPQRVRQVMQEGGLEQGWAWHEPKLLLGHSCFHFMNRDKVDEIHSVLSGPLGQTNVAKLAPSFAVAAEQCLEDIVDGRFNFNIIHRPRNKHNRKRWDKKLSDIDVDDHSDNNNNYNDNRSCDGNDVGPIHHKVRWEALRSYTMDLIDGPVLGFDFFPRNAQRPIVGNDLAMFEEPIEKFEDEYAEKETQHVRREVLLLWMERLKYGMCYMRMSLGADWLQMWRMSAYQRALNARKHLHKMVSRFVETSDVHNCSDQGTTATEQPSSLEQLSSSSSLAPSLLTDPPSLSMRAMTGDLFRQRNAANDRIAFCQSRRRARSLSETDFVDPSDCMRVRLLDPEEREIARRRHRAYTDSNLCSEGDGSGCHEDSRHVESTSSATSIPLREKPLTVLDQIRRAEDERGQALDSAVVTDISLLLWMMLDIGQSYTAMALDVLARKVNIYHSVQAELTYLIHTYGEDRLYTPFVMGRMTKLNALIYESIRICPDFLGGLRVTTKTVEIEDVQIPKNTQVILCNQTDPECNLHRAMHKKPEDMGTQYPSEELNGFLPLEGLEIPLLVLQTKVFLIAFLKTYRPVMTEKRTFIHRVHRALSGSFHEPSLSSGGDDDRDLEIGGCFQVEERIWSPRQSSLRSDLPDRPMRAFPTPEPKRVVMMRRR